MLMSVWLIEDVVLAFCYSNLTQESDILQANQLAKCASHSIDTLSSTALLYLLSWL